MSRPLPSLLPLLLILLRTPLPLLPTADASSAAGQDTLIGVVGRDFVILGADSSSSSSVALTSSNLDKIAVLSDPFPSGRGDDATVVGGSNGDGGAGVGEKQRDEEEEEELARRRSWEQQPVAAAAAGDAADADRLLGILGAHCAVREYEAGIGCDVETVYDGGGGGGGGAPMSPAGLDAEAVAHLARGTVANSLRSGRGHLKVCLLVAGMVRAASSAAAAAATSPPGVGSGETADGAGRRGGIGEECDDALRHGAREDLDDEDPTFAGRIRRQIEAATSGLEISRTNGSTRTITLPTDPESDEVVVPTRQQQRQQQRLIPRLLWLDEYGSLQRLQYGAHGHGSNFALSILDRGYRPNMSRDEAAALVRDCFEQLRTRYVINSPMPPCIKCVDSEGCSLVR